MDKEYENIRLAILEQAVRDYMRALKKRNGGAIGHLEKWFLSDWGQRLSFGSGHKIINLCRKCVGTKPRNRNAKRY